MMMMRFDEDIYMFSRLLGRVVRVYENREFEYKYSSKCLFGIMRKIGL